MSHVRKLKLSGEICNRGKRVTSYYSWPELTTQNNVERLISTFRKNFCNVTVVIEHNLDVPS